MMKDSKVNSEKTKYSQNVIKVTKDVMFTLAFIHLCYLFIFTYFKIHIMTIVNIFSISIYIWMYFKVNKDKYAQFIKYTFWEVIIHVIMSGLMIGEGTGFSMFCIVLLVIVRTAGYFYKRVENKVLDVNKYLMIASAFFIAFALSGNHHEPLYGVDNYMLIEILDVFNSVVVIYSVNYYIFMTSREIYKYEDELKEKNELLHKMSYMDSLTMIYNRRGIQAQFNRCREENKRFSIILCDIDDFKNINDKYGHECGDMILREIAVIIKHSVEGKGSVARWGGEEILVLNENDNIDAYMLGEQIRKNVEDANFIYEHNSISITITVGIGYDKNLSTREAILKADRNLYIGKRKGKNIVIK